MAHYKNIVSCPISNSLQTWEHVYSLLPIYVCSEYYIRINGNLIEDRRFKFMRINSSGNKLPGIVEPCRYSCAMWLGGREETIDLSHEWTKKSTMKLPRAKPTRKKLSYFITFLKVYLILWSSPFFSVSLKAFLDFRKFYQHFPKVSGVRVTNSFESSINLRRLQIL